MNPFLYYLFQFLKLVVKISFRVYYAKKVVLNKERGKYNNPCVVVFNHPCTMMDALNAAANIGPQAFFFVNAGLYKTALGSWVFNTFYSIPIQRYKDTGGKPLDNKNSFSKGVEHLSSGGTLLIAPEGSSYSERKLRKIKTGAARVALETEIANDFQLGLTILPIGINYEAPRFFRKNVLVNIGEPILIKKYKAEWEKDNIGAMRSITEEIRQSFENLLTATEDDQEERLLVEIETVLQSEHPIHLEKEFYRSKKILANSREFKVQNPDGYATFQSSINNYFDHLNQAKIRDLVVKKPKVTLVHFLKLLLGFPLFLFGALNNLIPAALILKLNKKLNPEPVYDSTVKYLAGLLFFPFFYFIQTLLVYFFIGNASFTLLYAISLFPLGLLAWNYFLFSKLFFERWRWKSLGNDLKKELGERRLSILKEIDGLVKD